MDTQTETVEEVLPPEVEHNLEGMEAGRAFAYKHILEKINLFLDVYRREGYSEDFVVGFLDGVNDVTGGTISLQADEEVDEETDDLLDNPPDSD